MNVAPRGETFEDRRTVAQLSQDSVTNRQKVAHHIDFGDAELREVHLVGVGHSNRVRTVWAVGGKLYRFGHGCIDPSPISFARPRYDSRPTLKSSAPDGGQVSATRLGVGVGPPCRTKQTG